MKMTLEQAQRVANWTWSGVYRVDRSVGCYRVRLHGPTGPLKWIRETRDGVRTYATGGNQCSPKEYSGPDPYDDRLWNKWGYASQG